MAPSPNTKALEDWFRASGGYLHNNIRIQYDRDSGVHYHTDAPIAAGTVFASAPHSLSLSYLNALVDDAFPVFNQQKHQFKIETIGFFYLMSQYLNGDKSFWKPYLDTLPKPEDLTQPLFFEDPADIMWLEDTDVWHTMTARKQVYEKYYHDGLTVLKEAGIDVAPYTWNLFKWSTTIFTSRSFTSLSLLPGNGRYWTTYRQGPDGRQKLFLDMSCIPAEDLNFAVLFPGLDAANHSHKAQVKWAFNPGLFGIGTNDGIEADQEVFNNYGPKGNDELLIGYGFCVPNNPYDTIAMTLKAPPEKLETELRSVQPQYFNVDGQWTSEKATFRLKRPTEDFDRPIQIFEELPESLLELLVCILQHERRFTYSPAPQPLDYVTTSVVRGQRYLPHLARMIVQSLIPKLEKFRAKELPSEPQNKKQAQAAVYRRSQTVILESLVSALRSYTRSIVWKPSQIEVKLPAGPVLVTLELFLPFLISIDRLDPAFLHGIEASANTQDLFQLRHAGWEEDVWVLLLCYLGLNVHQNLDVILPEYHDLLSADKRSLQIIDQEEQLEQSESLMEIVHTASSACPGSLWSDERWSSEYIARFGGTIMGHESFTIMYPLGEGVEEARLCALLHSTCWVHG